MKQENENEKNAVEVERPFAERLVMEIIGDENKKHKAKNWIIAGLILAIAAVSISLTFINYKINCKWQDLFSSYEFVTQDGGGQNYYNSDVGGNINNGTKNNEKKE